MNRSRLATLLTCGSLAVAVAAVACSDSVVEPRQTEKAAIDNDQTSALAAPHFLQGRMLIRSAKGDVEIPMRPVAARLVSTGTSEHWEPIGKFEVDSQHVKLRTHLADDAPAQEEADVLSVQARILSAGPQQQHLRQTRPRYSDLGDREGKHYSMAEASDQSAPEGHPPRLTVILANGKPALAYRGEYQKHAGKWQLVGATLIAFDSTGKQMAVTRVDHRAGKNVRRVGATGRAITQMVDVVATRIGQFLSPAELEAAQKSCFTERAVMWGAFSALVIGFGTTLLAGAACETTAGAVIPACVATLVLAVGTFAAGEAFVYAFEALQECKAGCGSSDRVAAQAPRLGTAFDRATATNGGQAASAISVDVSHFNRNGKWVRQFARLRPAQ